MASLMNVCKNFENLWGIGWQVDELSQDLNLGLTGEQIYKLMKYKDALISKEQQLTENKLKRFKADMLIEKQVDMMSDILEKKGIKPVKRKASNGELFFYVGDEVVFGVGILPNGNVSYTIFDRSIYDKYFADDENATFCFVLRTNSNDYKVRCFVEGYRNGIGIELHQLVLKEKGVKLEEDVVDHKSCNAQLNTSDILRKANYRQNKMNRKYINSKLRDALRDCQGDYDRHKVDCARQVAKEQEEGGEFAYDPLNDFSNTWYALVLHRMLGRGTAEELKDYNRDFMFRHDKVAYYYYESIF